jgi:hypothetical protein
VPTRSRLDAERLGESSLRLKSDLGALLGLDDRGLGDVRAARQLALTERLVESDRPKLL